MAAILIFHGIIKFPVAPEGAMGLSSLIVTLVALAEIGAGLLLLAGAFAGSMVTRLGALLVLPVMIGAIIRVHWPRWSFTAAEGFPMGGMEFQVLLLLLALFFLIRGNGSSKAESAA